MIIITIVVVVIITIIVIIIIITIMAGSRMVERGPTARQGGTPLWGKVTLVKN